MRNLLYTALAMAIAVGIIALSFSAHAKPCGHGHIAASRTCHK